MTRHIFFAVFLKVSRTGKNQNKAAIFFRQYVILLVSRRCFSVCICYEMRILVSVELLFKLHIELR